jgi:DNA modification methylase
MNANTIYNMDCLDGLKQVEDNTVDLIVTSPPYYNARQYAQWPDYEDYLFFVLKVVNECVRVLKRGGFICWNVSPRIVVNSKKYSLGFDMQRILEYAPDSRVEPELLYYDNLIWLKPKGGYRLSFAETKWQKMSKDGDRPVRLMPRYENIFVYSKGDPFECRYQIDKQYEHEFWYWGNVCELPVDHLPGHHGVFPIDLPLQMIDWFSTSKDGIVLDPFMGSGSTAVAAKQLGKQYLGFEIHTEFIEIAEERLKNVL